uniref:DAN domain-containing protein n=1 Tax=Anopheles atroparvus TaxID=41427 RepID=A0A182JC19_ANOAO
MSGDGNEDGGSRYSADDCQVTPVIHVLQYPGCVPKPIPSFACIGRCASYIQVSGSKIWQMERSCMCCQESGEREASVSLFCPKAKNGEKKFRKPNVPTASEPSANRSQDNNFLRHHQSQSPLKATESLPAASSKFAIPGTSSTIITGITSITDST